MKNLPDTLDGWLHYCEHLHPHTIEMGLDRVALVKERLSLHLDCPVITVAGTNGKGSTCAMIEAVALQAGYRPGVYTSPHLVHFEERCRIHGETVKPEELLPHFEAVERARTEGSEVQLTYFEFTTLAILRLISQARVDVAVLEVGMGGRLDAVNVIDADCAVITMMDVDHAEFLGPDRESIGREKAGIMRPGRPVVVCDPVPPESVIEHAKAIGATLWRFGTDFNYSGDKLQWSWAGAGGATRACPTRRCAAPTSSSTRRARWRRWRRSARSCRFPPRRGARASPWWSCRGALKWRRASPWWCWMWRTTRMPWPRWPRA